MMPFSIITNPRRLTMVLLAPVLLALSLILIGTYPLWRGLGPALTPVLKPDRANVELGSSNTTGIPLTIPDGYSISIYAEHLGSPRVMQYDNGGNMLVTDTNGGRVLALRDTSNQGRITSVEEVLIGLNNPHGLAFRCAEEICTLYVATTDAVTTYEYDGNSRKATNPKKIIDLPNDGGHFTRTLMFLPYPRENELLISVGSSCNVCTEKDSRRAAILVANADGTDLRPYATGLRNSVFMAIHPVDGNIWATDHGRDQLGDDLPPDEINRISEGKNYGWPICYGKNVHDSKFDKNTYIRGPCTEPFEQPSYIDLQAHSAPMGIAFIPEEGWPQDHWFNALVAYHGSWNRTTPTGYKIVRIKLNEKGEYFGMEDFITGWLSGSRTYGRPVDIMVQPGGTVYISDDKAGVIYRMQKNAQEEIQPNVTAPLTVLVPQPNAVVSSPLTINGSAPGTWYFEASFPINLYDGNNVLIAQTIGTAQSDWMTTADVPFTATMTFAPPNTSTGTLVFQKDNPSGLPQYDASVSIPIAF